MSGVDQTAALRRTIRRQNEEISQLRRVILWQAEGSRPDCSWLHRAPTATSLSVSAEDVTKGEAVPPLVWVKGETGHRARSCVALPVEVLAEIASCLPDRADLVSLGKASLELLAVAMRELMERRPVKLETATQTVQMFCRRVGPSPDRLYLLLRSAVKLIIVTVDRQGRAPGFPHFLTGNNERLSPMLNLTHLQDVSIPFVNDEFYNRWGCRSPFATDRVTIPTEMNLIEEGRWIPYPQPEDRVRLRSLTFIFPTGLEGWEEPMNTDPTQEWFTGLCNMFDPVNLVLLQTPTPDYPLARLVIDPEANLNEWTRLERCICVGVVPEISCYANRDYYTPFDDKPLTEWPTQDGLPDLVLFLVGLKDADEDEPRELLAEKCARRLDEGDKFDQDGPLRWNVQFWLQDEDAVTEEKEHLQRRHLKGIRHATGEHFEITWRTWTPGTNGDDRHTRLFGLPFEDDGWLSQAWFDEHDLE